MEPEHVIADLKQRLADAQAEVGSLKKALDKREADNKDARDKVKALETELETTKALLPGSDTVTLAGDDVKAWAAYQELGKPDLVRVKLEDYDRATGEAATLKRRELVDKAARDPQDETRYRYKPSVLERLLADATLTTGKDGHTVKVGDTEKPLEKWLEEDQADFLPALQAQPNGTPAVGQAGDRRTLPAVSQDQVVANKRATGDYNL